MKLHEIIAANESNTTSILVEKLLPYKRSLLTYYKDLFCCEPILMVTDVFNAAQYAKIVPANEFMEAIGAYLEDDNCTDESSENFASFETINFNSIMLSSL